MGEKSNKVTTRDKKWEVVGKQQARHDSTRKERRVDLLPHQEDVSFTVLKIKPIEDVPARQKKGNGHFKYRQQAHSTNSKKKRCGMH